MLSNLVRRPRRFLSKTPLGGAYRALKPPSYPRLRLTPKRLLNYYLLKYQRARGHTKLLGYPMLMALEATNVCNLKCPHCFTGAGRVGRERSMIPMPLYKKVMDELGDYLCYIEFVNWGEAFLNKNIYEMIRMASSRGICTLIATNFSIPFDEARAEALVKSELALLGVSLDGATQENYEKYRVGGDIEKVLNNVRLVNEAKKKLGSDLPRMVWSYHVFEWNKDEVDMARSKAHELGMEFAFSKGWVEGEEWDRRGEFGFSFAEAFHLGLEPERCKFLWLEAVINNDGGVAPCDCTYYTDDDYGSVTTKSFKEVWNNKQFQEARRQFRSRDAAADGNDLVCHDCPYTVNWENYQRHRAQGLTASSFDPAFTVHDWFNYHFSRRPGRGASETVDSSIDLRPVEKEPSSEQV